MRTSRLQDDILRYATVALRAHRKPNSSFAEGGMEVLLGVPDLTESLALRDLLRSFPRLQLSEWSLAFKPSHQSGSKSINYMFSPGKRAS